jgi:hypothetical protein
VEVANFPLLDPHTELGDGLASSNTELLVQRILVLPEVSPATIGHKRVDGETSPSSSIGAFARKRRRGKASSKADATALVFVKKARTGSG